MRSYAYLSLEQRTQMANKAQADLFLSIHFNAGQSKTASGPETFVLTPRDQPSRLVMLSCDRVIR